MGPESGAVGEGGVEGKGPAGVVGAEGVAQFQDDDVGALVEIDRDGAGAEGLVMAEIDAGSVIDAEDHVIIPGEADACLRSVFRFQDAASNGGGWLGGGGRAGDMGAKDVIEVDKSAQGGVGEGHGEVAMVAAGALGGKITGVDRIPGQVVHYAEEVAQGGLDVRDGLVIEEDAQDQMASIAGAAG